MNLAMGLLMIRWWADGNPDPLIATFHLEETALTKTTEIWETLKKMSGFLSLNFELELYTFPDVEASWSFSRYTSQNLS
jgi:hypothetical protein